MSLMQMVKRLVRMVGGLSSPTAFWDTGLSPQYQETKAQSRKRRVLAAARRKSPTPASSDSRMRTTKTPRPVVLSELIAAQKH